MSVDEHVELLRRVSIFKGLNDEALRAIGSSLRSQRYSKDTTIFNQDDEGDSLYIIVKGRVKVVLYGENGREAILTIFGPGDFFGEMSLLDGQPRSANIITLENTTTLALSRSDFTNHLHANPATALRILEEMCIRLRYADDIIGNLALLDVYGRVARILIGLAKKDGEVVDEGVLIRQRPTQQELASMIGTSRETVSRVLSEYQRRGMLSMQGKSVLLSHGFAEQTFE